MFTSTRDFSAVTGILRKLVTATPKFIYSRVMIILKCYVSTAANKDGRAGGVRG